MTHEEAMEAVAEALALEMYPDARWPRNEKDANSCVDDRQGRYPISWHFANKCRSQAHAAISAYLKAMGSEPVAPMSDAINALRLVVKYDDFLRNFTGPVDAISASDNAAIDDAYDQMVAAARSALRAKLSQEKNNAAE